MNNVNPSLLLRSFSLCLFLCLAVFSASAQVGDDGYLNWSSGQAEAVGRSMRVNGRVGGFFDLRVIRTERSFNYKLRATLMTPEMIRASARMEQLRNRLSDDETKALVAEAEGAGDLVVIVEIDPREGSGVIPLDWRVFIQPKDFKGEGPGVVAGTKSPELKRIKALSGVFRRDYAYDIFWVVFPLVDAQKRPLVSPELRDLELLVGIYGKEGRVNWPMPSSIREKIQKLSN